METCLIFLMLLLGSQVAETQAPRYPSLENSSPLGTPNLAAEAAAAFDQESQSAAAQPPVESAPSNPLRETTSAPPSVPGGLTKLVKPAAVLTRLTTPLRGEQLQGNELSLSAAIQSARTRAEQTRRVQNYWELSQAVAVYRLAARELLELQTQRNGLAQPDAAWDQAIRSAQNRLTTANSAVRTAQYRLQHELGRMGESTLPMPSDAPHCGSYETKFRQIFQGRSSQEAEELSELLPLRHELLRQLAAEVEAAGQWLSLVSQQRSAASSGLNLLKAYEQLALQREAFVTAAYRYNDEIVRYTELAVPQQIGTVRLVSMLIQTDTREASDWQEGAIQRASAQEPVESESSAEPPPQTYEDSTRNRSFRVSPKDEAGERSILVKQQEAQSK